MSTPPDPRDARPEDARADERRDELTRFASPRPERNFLRAALAAFVNERGRLRSGWRLAVFAVVFFLAAGLAQLLIVVASGGPQRAEAFFSTLYGNAFNRFVVLFLATVVAWVCGRVLEGLPLRAFGWAAHRGWLRDFLVGSLVGVGSLLAAVLVGALFGGYRFSFAASEALPAALKSLVIAAVFFVVAGAAEEALLRGYPLQTLLRSLPAWVPLALTALLFGAMHLGNPNAAFLPFVNTSLAGVWLAVAYLRTRSLWFPTGIHWAWNWTLGPVLGLPVSGLTMLSRAPLAPTEDLGPAWLTGGAYGVEGGAVCTVALIASTLFIWRTRLVSADPEMKSYTERDVSRQS
ncbi:MAG TPA: type II CAAX endopeptidase family protein [Pyrinomonadaceae bacterium]|nr:type II CAAX endopeptidase family protein [Pyrinomonadaceae bacterium]